MKKTILIFIILLSCSSNENDKELGDITVSYDECLDISESKFQICLDSIDDSRCPSHVVCVWGGDAMTHFSLKTNKGIKQFTLHTNSSFQQDTVIDGIKIRLLNVSPYPNSDEEIDIRKYTAEMEVVEQ